MSAILTWTADHLSRGNAVCRNCLMAHPEAGQAHRESPWRITPRCVACGDVLTMPIPRDSRIRDLWDGGLTIVQIGMEVGASRETVRRAARRMGLPSRAHRANWRAA